MGVNRNPEITMEASPLRLTPAGEEEEKNRGLQQIEKDCKNRPARKEQAVNSYLTNYRASQQERDEYFQNITATAKQVFNNEGMN